MVSRQETLMCLHTHTASMNSSLRVSGSQTTNPFPVPNEGSREGGIYNVRWFETAERTKYGLLAAEIRTECKNTSLSPVECTSFGGGNEEILTTRTRAKKLTNRRKLRVVEFSLVFSLPPPRDSRRARCT
eukprot:1338468-Amorphochlora_amoeboformis.AAC.1